MFNANFANSMIDTVMQGRLIIKIDTVKSLVESGDISQSRCDELILGYKAYYADEKVALNNCIGDCDEGDL